MSAKKVVNSLYLRIFFRQVAHFYPFRGRRSMIPFQIEAHIHLLAASSHVRGVKVFYRKVDKLHNKL